ncbi:MAG: (2Fe-2S) ferredoxin domain-containing protein [Clostridia bacterium]|nr:(2Fe-2S) ferredoxin domain-containing protein [Clostridia bacterium]
MKITICIGSSCHIKGSRQIVEALSAFVSEHHLEDKIELGGTFCMDRCQEGVCVTVDDEFYSLTPETVSDFIKNRISPEVSEFIQ